MYALDCCLEFWRRVVSLNLGLEVRGNAVEDSQRCPIDFGVMLLLQKGVRYLQAQY